MKDWLDKECFSVIFCFLLLPCFISMSLIVLVKYSPSIDAKLDRAVIEAKEEYRLKIQDSISCKIYIEPLPGVSAYTNIKDKEIYIDSRYWNTLDFTSNKVIILRELLHCELGIPYMVGMSIMNRNIVVARAIYQYGADQKTHE